MVGLDPGVHGGIAILQAETETLLSVIKMPIYKVRVGKTDRLRIARQELLDTLNQARGSYVWIERPEARPLPTKDRKTGQTVMRQPGAAGMFSFGESYGVTIMGCTAAGMRITEVRPGDWKRSLSVPASKDDARRRATELFPDFAPAFKPVGADGLAEAALIALCGARQLRATAI